MFTGDTLFVSINRDALVTPLHPCYINLLNKPLNHTITILSKKFREMDRRDEIQHRYIDLLYNRVTTNRVPNIFMII